MLNGRKKSVDWIGEVSLNCGLIMYWMGVKVEY